MQADIIDRIPGSEESPQEGLTTPQAKELHAEIRRHVAVMASLKEALSTLHELLEEDDFGGDFEAYCAREFGFDVEALFEATDCLKL